MRNVSADLLRIICCLMIIGIHATPDYSLMVKINAPNIILYQSLIIQSLVRIGLPVFFMMSGYFLLNRKTEPLLTGYRKRFISLLIPFLIYAFVNYYFQHKNIFDKEGISGFFRLLVESKTAISTHLWYVYVLTGIYLVYPALKVITDSITSEKALSAIVVIAVICSWSSYEGQIPKIWADYKSVVPLPKIDLWVGYFLIGGLLQRIDAPKKLTILLFAASLPIQIIATWASVNKFGFDLKPYDFGINMFFASSMLILFVNNIHIPSSSLSAKVICFLAPYTYGIYLIHIVIMKLISDYFSVPSVVEMVTIKTICYMVTVFIASLICAIIIDNLLIKRIVSFAR